MLLTSCNKVTNFKETLKYSALHNASEVNNFFIIMLYLFVNIYLSDHSPVCLSVCLSVCLPVSFCLPVSLPVCPLLFIYLFIYLQIYQVLGRKTTTHVATQTHANKKIDFTYPLKTLLNITCVTHIT